MLINDYILYVILDVNQYRCVQGTTTHVLGSNKSTVIIH